MAELGICIDARLRRLRLRIGGGEEHWYRLKRRSVAACVED